MQAVLVKSLKHGNKTIVGDVLQDGFDRITLAVTDKRGSKNIKRFKKSDYVIRYLEK